MERNENAAGVPAGDVEPRRHVPTIVATILAVAVVVAVVLWSLGRSPTGPAQGPATTAASSSPSATTPTATSAKPATTSGAPQTGYAELRDAYAVGDTLRIGGRTIQLERGTVVHDFAVLDGGGSMVASSMDGIATRYDILDSSGRTIRRIEAPSEDRPGSLARWAVSPDGRRVLFSTGQKVTVFDASGAVVATRSSDGEAAAIVGDRAHLGPSSPDGDGSSTEWDVATGATREIPHHVRAVDREGRLAAVSWQPPELGDGYLSCWAILDLQNGFRSMLERCGGLFIPKEFSSDGTYVVGQNYIDGGDVYNLAVARAADGTFAIGGTDRADWFLGWSIRMSEDEKTVLVARSTSPPGADRPLEVTLVRCSLTLECTTVQPERSFAFLARPPFVVSR